MTNIYITLLFFVYIIAASIMYMIVKDVLRFIFNKKVETLKDTFGKEVLKQLNAVKDNKDISTLDINYIKGKLKSKIYIKIFNDVIINFNKNEKNHMFTMKYMYNFEDMISAAIKKYRRKDNIIKTYLAFILGEYKLDTYEVNEFLLKNIRTEYMDLRSLSLMSLSKIGNLNNCIEAIEYLSYENKYINNKILVDILGQFNGDKILLNQKLLDKFSILSQDIKKSIIENLKNNEISFAKENLLEILKDKNTEKEVKISIIKYFATIKYEVAKTELVRMLKEEDWECRAVCAYALKNYKDKESMEALLKSIGDKNWHVRYNSAMSLLNFEEKYILEKVFQKMDTYSRDILLYAMSSKEKSRKVEV